MPDSALECTKITTKVFVPDLGALSTSYDLDMLTTDLHLVCLPDPARHSHLRAVCPSLSRRALGARRDGLGIVAGSTSP
jgi:hypothetical protein